MILGRFFAKLRSCGSRNIFLKYGRMHVAVRSDGTVMFSEGNTTGTILTVEHLGGDRIALKSYLGTYLATESNMANRWRQVVEVKANRKEISITEVFHVIERSYKYPPVIALLNCKRHLTKGDGPEVLAASNIGRRLKWFFPECVGNMMLSLHTSWIKCR